MVGQDLEQGLVAIVDVMVVEGSVMLCTYVPLSIPSILNPFRPLALSQAFS